MLQSQLTYSRAAKLSSYAETWRDTWLFGSMLTVDKAIISRQGVLETTLSYFVHKPHFLGLYFKTVACIILKHTLGIGLVEGTEKDASKTYNKWSKSTRYTLMVFIL